MKPTGVWVLLALIVFATVMFGIGAAVERATAPTSTTVVHQETPGAEAAGAGSAHNSANSEAILGFNPESTPLIVGAIVASVVVVAAVWRYWRRPAVVWAAGGVMAAFAVLDIVEVARQVAEGHVTLVVLAGTVAILHGAAAAMAIRVVTAESAVERAAAS